MQIDNIDINKLSPMMRQYVEIKQQNALVYIAVSFIHSFIGKPMDMNYLPGIFGSL